MDSIVAKPVAQIQSERYQELVKQSFSHLQLIENIKEEVAQEWDNLHQPVPFIQGNNQNEFTVMS